MIDTASHFYSYEREILGKVCPLDTPFRLAISVSEVCNFKCKYCFRSVSDTLKSGYTTLPFMSTNMFKKVVKQAKQFPSKIKKIFLNVTGEPLCHKELPQMIKFIKNEIPDSIVSIQTNGSLLTHGLSEDLVNSGLDDILISLQGLSSEKYKAICDANINFNDFVDNIKYLYEYKTKSKSNLHLYVKMPDIALETNQNKIYYDIFNPISDQATIEKINPVFNEVDYSKIGINNFSTANRLGTDYGNQEVCSIAFYGLTVTTNGNVYPCVQSVSPCTFGNINTESLVEIWNGKVRTEFLKKMLRRESIPRCDICTSKNACVLSDEDRISPYATEVLERILSKERSI